MLPLSRPPLSPAPAIHRAPASRPTYFPAHTGLSAQTYTSSSYSPASTPLDEQPHIHLSAPLSEMPEPTHVRQADALRSIDDEAEEKYTSGDGFRDMHLTVDDHAGDPAARYELMELLGTGNFGKVYKA
jgi:hypothetical protein